MISGKWGRKSILISQLIFLSKAQRTLPHLNIHYDIRLLSVFSPRTSVNTEHMSFHMCKVQTVLANLKCHTSHPSSQTSLPFHFSLSHFVRFSWLFCILFHHSGWLFIFSISFFLTPYFFIFFFLTSFFVIFLSNSLFFISFFLTPYFFISFFLTPLFLFISVAPLSLDLCFPYFFLKAFFVFLLLFVLL